jgi:hypothetical protein
MSERTYIDQFPRRFDNEGVLSAVFQVTDNFTAATMASYLRRLRGIQAIDDENDAPVVVSELSQYMLTKLFVNRLYSRDTDEASLVASFTNLGVNDELEVIAEAMRPEHDGWQAMVKEALNRIMTKLFIAKGWEELDYIMQKIGVSPPYSPYDPKVVDWLADFKNEWSDDDKLSMLQLAVSLCVATGDIQKLMLMRNRLFGEMTGDESVAGRDLWNQSMLLRIRLADKLLQSDDEHFIHKLAGLEHLHIWNESGLTVDRYLIECMIEMDDVHF